ncbi:hypothetical protein P879_09369 [Paragonimus westermani]|uniref:EF-hand domain-containing protein n=1 Tax=Paragonimus westermani TaxID=34504 RepID=A0A8T0D5Y3_9TREM|nr:hypothetical protein P879_09369 [Paragonimus westermani]
MAEAAQEGFHTSSASQLDLENSRILNKLEALTHKDASAMRNRVKNYIKSWKDYQNFVSRVDVWYHKNEKKYLRYMSLYAREFLTETEFKLALHDLQTPFIDAEVDVLYQMLDPTGTGRVDYTQLYRALWMALAEKYISDDNFHSLDLEQHDKWLMLTFKVPSCEPFDMPTTFEHLVDLSYTGAMLRTIIQVRIQCLPTRAIVLFTDVARYAETIIHCNQPLFEFPFHGGPKCAPEEAVIYYEFSMGRIDCPLIANSCCLAEYENDESSTQSNRFYQKTASKLRSHDSNNHTYDP